MPLLSVDIFAAMPFCYAISLTPRDADAAAERYRDTALPYAALRAALP